MKLKNLVLPVAMLLLVTTINVNAASDTQKSEPAKSSVASQRPEDPNSFLSIEKRAKKGEADAQYAVGHMYLNLSQLYTVGNQVVMNKAYAYGWFRKAAEQGHKEAKTALTKFNPDSQEVYVWSRIEADENTVATGTKGVNP